MSTDTVPRLPTVRAWLEAALGRARLDGDQELAAAIEALIERAA